jgi:NDP-sugar pyrophosphorylase family protein
MWVGQGKPIMAGGYRFVKIPKMLLLQPVDSIPLFQLTFGFVWNYLEIFDLDGHNLGTVLPNIYRFSFKPLWEVFVESEHHYVVALPETDPAKLKKIGVLELAQNDRVLRLHEKLQNPSSTWSCPPLYFLQHSAWSILQKFVENADNLDAPGHFLDYLCRTENVAAFKLNAFRLDIGSIDSDREANRFLGRKSLII